MVYLVSLCIFLLLVTLPLPAALEALAKAQARRRAPPAPPPRGFRPVVIEGGKRDAPVNSPRAG